MLSSFLLIIFLSCVVVTEQLQNPTQFRRVSFHFSTHRKNLRSFGCNESGQKKIFNDSGQNKIFVKYASQFFVFVFSIWPVVYASDKAMALNMGTVFQSEERLSDEDTDTKFDVIGLMKQLVDSDKVDEEEMEKSQMESSDLDVKSVETLNSDASLTNGVQAEIDIDSPSSSAGVSRESLFPKRPLRKIAEDSSSEAEDQLPPISRRQIDRMLRSGIEGIPSSKSAYKDNSQGFMFDEDGQEEEEEELLPSEMGEGESRRAPERGMAPEQFMEEKAMFEEVIGEIMSSGDMMKGIYDVQFTPLDPTIIPVITTSVFLYFWLKQGTDDEMPQSYNQQKIDGYFASQPLLALQRALEIVAGVLEMALLRQGAAVGLLNTTADSSSTAGRQAVAEALVVQEMAPALAVLAPSPSAGTSEVVEVMKAVVVGGDDVDNAVRLRQLLGGLGPTFIKLGQALANRPDIVGRATATELTQLQDRLPPFPYEEVCLVMERELGKPPHLLFDEFSAEPVAAGSLGQVHKARVGNQWLAVKVKRPGVLDEIGKDLYILRQVVGLLPVKVDLVSVVDDYGQALMEEIDYRREVENMIRFRKLYGRMPNILVPRVMADYCSDNIITMEWVEGQRIVQRSLSVSREDLPLLETGITCTLKQLLEVGFLHADPHGGNLLKTFEKPARLAYLDFGIVTEVPLEVRDAILCAVVFLVNGDFEGLAGTFPSLMLVADDKMDDRIPQFASALRKVFGPLLEEARDKGEVVPRLPFGSLLKQLFDIAQSFQFSIPPYFLSNVRALAELEGLALTADPNYNLLSSVYPFAVQRILINPDPKLRGALEQLIFDPEEGLRTEVLRSMFGLSMPMPCAPRRTTTAAATAVSGGNGKRDLPMCDDVLRVTPSRAQYGFVQQVLVKLLAARVWLRLSLWMDDVERKYLPKFLWKGLPGHVRSSDPLEAKASYSTTKLLKQFSLVRPKGLEAKFLQSVMLVKVFVVVCGRIVFKFGRRSFSDGKSVLEYLLGVGWEGTRRRLRMMWSYWWA